MSGPYPTTALLLTLAAAACQAPADTGQLLGPDPWADLEASQPDPFAEALSTPLTDALQADALLVVDPWPVTVVHDAAGLLLLDPRYRHDGAQRCISTEAWPHLEDGVDRQGPCDDGEAHLQRGRFRPDTGVSAFAATPGGAALVATDADGVLYQAPLDPTQSNPLDILRFVPVGQIDGPPRLLVADDDGLFAVISETLARLAADGTTLDAIALPGTAAALALVDGSPWVATSAGVLRATPDLSETSLVPGSAAALASGAGGAWLSLPDDSAVAWLSATATAHEDPMAIDGLLGPLAWDAGAERLYVVGDDSVIVVERGETVRTESVVGALSIGLTTTHELVVLRTGDSTGDDTSGGSIDDTVTVFLDETALGDRPPVHLTIAAFTENPKDPGQVERCRGDGETMTSIVALSRANREWLSDLPATVALGITPQVARQVAGCGLLDEFEPVWHADRSDPGVLFHEEPAADEVDPIGFIERELRDWSVLGAEPGWASGMTTWRDLGFDWVSDLATAGGPTRHLFFGMAIAPDIPQEDPRAKDPYPYPGEVTSRGWRAADSATATTDDPSGVVALYPGNAVRGFALADCPNLFVRECIMLDAGGGPKFTQDDADVLSLLVFRAIAARSDDGPDTWYFHLPALGVTDYAEDCTTTDRLWQGDDCEAALLQDWSLNTHARFVLNGLAVWTQPRQLPWPEDRR